MVSKLQLCSPMLELIALLTIVQTGYFPFLKGRDKNAYYHEYFLRGRSLLCHQIVRTKVKGRGARKASSPETEPRLYELPWMPDSRPSTSQQAKEKASQPFNATPTSAGVTSRASTMDPTLFALAERAPASSVPGFASTALPKTGLEAARLTLPFLSTSLGDALTVLNYSHALQTAAGGAYNLQRATATQGEVMLLPAAITRDNTSIDTSSTAILNSLLASLGTNPPPGARVPSSISNYAPVAPTASTHVLPVGHFKPWEDTNGTGSAAKNAYVTLLAALKAQHLCNAAAPSTAVSNQNVGASARLGPPSF